MESIYRKFYIRTPALRVLNSLLVLLWLAVVACHTNFDYKNQQKEISSLLEKTRKQNERLHYIKEHETELRQRFDLIFNYDGFPEDENVNEILGSAAAFLQELPLLMSEVQDEIQNREKQLQMLMKEINQQLHTTDEVTVFLIKENKMLDQLVLKVDYVSDRFTAWQLNAETIESAMRNYN